MMIHRIGMHGPDDAQLIRHFPQAWQVITNNNPALPARLKDPWTRQRRRIRLRKRQLQILRELRRQRFSMVFLQRRFRIEEIHLARPALHEHEDHALRLRGKMRLLRRQRIHRRAMQKIGERHPPNAITKRIQ
jgi:hypothetical protein